VNVSYVREQIDRGGNSAGSYGMTRDIRMDHKDIGWYARYYHSWGVGDGYRGSKLKCGLADEIKVQVTT